MGPSRHSVTSSKRVSHTGLDGAERRPQVPHESSLSINNHRCRSTYAVSSGVSFRCRQGVSFECRLTAECAAVSPAVGEPPRRRRPGRRAARARPFRTSPSTSVSEPDIANFVALADPPSPRRTVGYATHRFPERPRMVVRQRREYIALADLRHTHIESTAAAAPLSRCRFEAESLSRSPWRPSSRGWPLSDSRPFGSRKACRRPHFGDRQLRPDGAVRSASVRITAIVGRPVRTLTFPCRARRQSRPFSFTLSRTGHCRLAGVCSPRLTICNDAEKPS